jgi:aldose 1-epimerase
MACDAFGQSLRRSTLVLGACAAMRAGAASAGGDDGRGAIAAVPPVSANSPFSAAVINDQEHQQPVVVLAYRDPENASLNLEARIAPAAGGNLFSLKFGGDELLVQPTRLAELARQRAGTPILYPTPNRVRDATFVFEKRRFELEANNGRNAIHGLVRHRAWTMDDAPVVTTVAASMKVYIDWTTKQQPDFHRFPIEHRLAVTYTLGRDGLLIGYAVDNRSTSRLPFGFGVHPFFRVPGARKDVFVSVPMRKRMEAKELLPTGRLLPVAGTSYDLRRPTSLEALDLDDVYIGVNPAAAPAFELRDRGIKVILGGSREFTHVVLYTPPREPFFCVENQTSSTDAHNLHARGLIEAAHLQVAEPNRTARGTIEWRLSRTGVTSPVVR